MAHYPTFNDIIMTKMIQQEYWEQNYRREIFHIHSFLYQKRRESLLLG